MRTDTVRRLEPKAWAQLARVVLWPLAVGSLLHLGVRSAVGRAPDLEILWRSGASLAAGGPLYDRELKFIYPPFSGWLFAPLGRLPLGAATVLVVALSLASAVAATVVLLRIVGVRPTSPVVPGVLLLLAHSRPLVGLLALGNIDAVLLLAEATVIALLVGNRDV